MEYIANYNIFSAPVDLACRLDEKNNSNQPYRNMFMRDRDRILYSKAFRRLAGKTQVYSSGTDEHRRTRLTHTLEVAQISGTISRGLGLNLDLTEAIALGHDIGHTPFGHAGEQILHEIMVPRGDSIIKDSAMKANIVNLGFTNCFGFKHNFQGVRTACLLERNYGTFGLDLTNYTLWGIQNHSSSCYKPKRVNTEFLICDIYNMHNQLYKCKDSKGVAWSFEAFVVKEADEIAQRHHDLEDAIRGNAVSRKEVCTLIQKNLFGLMDARDSMQLQEMMISTNSLTEEMFISGLSRIVVNTLVNRIIDCSIQNLKRIKQERNITQENVLAFFTNTSETDPDILSTISFETELEVGKKINEKLRELQRQIEIRVLNTYDVQRMDIKGKYIIRKLFQAYYANPQQLPDHSISEFLVSIGQYNNIERAQQISAQKGRGYMRMLFERKYNKEDISKNMNLMRIICDHIASLTDNGAISEYQALYG